MQHTLPERVNVEHVLFNERNCIIKVECGSTGSAEIQKYLFIVPVYVYCVG